MATIPNLDDEAIDALADLICGNNRDWYKTQSRLPQYFRNAGLECEDFDRETRSRSYWVAEKLRQYQSDPEQFFRAITRIADPKEHRGKPENARQALSELNSILEPDGIKVVWEQDAFKLDGTEFKFSSEHTAAPMFLSLDIDSLLPDPQFSKIVQARFNEAAKSRSAGAYLSAVIMLGSGLEGLLFGFIDNRQATAISSVKAPTEKNGKVKPLSAWTLHQLIDVAHDVGWIHKDAHAFGQNVRDFRNLVHPEKELRGGYQPTDEGTCRVCWEVVAVVIEDLKNQVKDEGSDEGEIPL